jgi:hypothetical protein
MQPQSKKIIWVTLFSIAMGFMETAVVVYLRTIYYPEGFNFPLVPIEPNIALIEFLREITTIIMLVGIGVLTGKNASQKFAYFIYSFAIWDIFYYVFLKLVLNWPESIFTWDILFLVPVPWVGPVLAPCIVSVVMIVFALYIIIFSEKKTDATLHVKDWLLLITGSSIVILSFLWDYLKYVAEHHSSNHIWTLSSKQEMFIEIAGYIPSDYNWWIFSIGQSVIIYTLVNYIRRIKNENNIQ